MLRIAAAEMVLGNTSGITLVQCSLRERQARGWATQTKGKSIARLAGDSVETMR